MSLGARLKGALHLAQLDEQAGTARGVPVFLNDDRRSGQMVLMKGVPDRHDADVCEPCGSSKSFLDTGLPSHPLMDDEGSLAKC